MFLSDCYFLIVFLRLKMSQRAASRNVLISSDIHPTDQPISLEIRCREQKGNDWPHWVGAVLRKNYGFQHVYSPASYLRDHTYRGRGTEVQHHVGHRFGQDEQGACVDEVHSFHLTNTGDDARATEATAALLEYHFRKDRDVVDVRRL